ncbi:MAG TPA: class I SAM-dependent methyltransferase [Candidatus Paceibacterota bacterium]|nr:class I SAM-dependent methyltransferase [Verrucomicrobiota bacterium]HSA10040.1 class I SAM-dependent methyltransferase [Candidatus Paceibacterota bacterium]
MASYTSQSLSLAGFLREVRSLYETQNRQASAQVKHALDHLRNVERLLEGNFGFQLHDRDVLDIGTGQFPLQMYYFGRHNRVTGIDFDVIANGVNPLQYLRMFRFNGLRRTTKSIARKLLGIDRKYRSELMAQLGVCSLPKVRVQRMDACNLTFADASFDCIHCLSVFHHLSDPAAAIQGIKRVLRPGGTVYISFHLYTSETGSLDPRVFTERAKEVGLWLHLRPECAHLIHTSAYLNKLRLEQWRRLFDTWMPGAVLTLTPANRAGAESDARALQAAGELSEYALEELLTHRIYVLWRKPGAEKEAQKRPATPKAE